MQFLRPLLPLLALHTIASFLHFAHNGLMLDDYPNLPTSITTGVVYRTWFAIVAAGLAGCLLIRLGFSIAGLIILALYAAAGLAGLAHYTLAPVAAHSLTMNLTIWFEVATAVALLVAICRTLLSMLTGANAAKRRSRG